MFIFEDLFLFFRVISLWLSGRGLRKGVGWGLGLFCFVLLLLENFKWRNFIFLARPDPLYSLMFPWSSEGPPEGFICVKLKTDLFLKERPFY